MAERVQRAQRTPMTAPVPPPVPEPATPPDSGGIPPRSVRRPFGARHARLPNPPIPGFQCYWFNDIPGRIGRAREAGYEHVLDDKGAPVKEIVGVSPMGGPLLAYRMKLPIEFANEDMVAKEGPRTQVDQDMRRGLAGKDGIFASPEAPGFHPERTIAANLDPATGKQRFSASPPDGGTQSQS
jgi:hypothetical protein